jgi:hypothetical protein
MREAERFSALIGDIDDAALDPSRWVGALAQMARFADATLGHAQATTPPSAAQQQPIVNFESGIFTAQLFDNKAKSLNADEVGRQLVRRICADVGYARLQARQPQLPNHMAARGLQTRLPGAMPLQANRPLLPLDAAQESCARRGAWSTFHVVGLTRNRRQSSTAEVNAANCPFGGR